MKRLLLAAVLLTAALAAAPARAALYGERPLCCGAAAWYFDGHNHLTGILPYQAYADLPAYIAGFANPAQGVSAADKLALYRYLADVWYPQAGAALGNSPFSPPDGQRFGFGARAALVVYADRVAGNVADLDGALERVLTATPWSEFDSAYAFRGGPASQYLLERYYRGDWSALGADLCRATILSLAQTNVDVSEQSFPLVGGWGFRDGRSDRLDTVECVMHAATDPTVQAGLRAMGRPMPVVKIEAMTHTSQLATLPGGAQYSEWSKTGTCAPAALAPALLSPPKTMENVLLGEDGDGKPVVPPQDLHLFYDTMIGVDTAGPETTCFTPDGMRYYRALVEAVYDASKARRAAGWHGKLLVHTHVGEGGVIDYSPSGPAAPWTFASTFASLPPTRSDSAQATDNVGALLAAIAQAERAHPDLHDYVVFRLAHDTWATPEQARAMRDEQVEADVNLESNVATGAYPISRMPLGASVVMSRDVDPLIGNVETNFELNDLLGVLVPSAGDDAQVGAVLGNASLRFLLENGVRCVLGTDADGVEHSDIVKEYAYAADLIRYWKATDPDFRAKAAAASASTIAENVRWHLRSMSTDTAQPY